MTNFIKLMSRIRVVLVRPQVAGNIGAVARLMENFQAGGLYLVDPLADHLDAEALHRSTHGQQRLHDACVVPNLAEALEGVVCAMGTSRRSGPVHQPDELTPRDLHQLIPQHINNGEVALLFGTEDKGLSREELLACDYLIQIPAQPDYPTLNLSHAAAICLYESFLAVAGSRIDESSKDRKGEPADLALINRLMDKLQHALYTIGYLHPQKPDHLMFPIRAILSRAELSRTEAQILIGLAQQIDEFAAYRENNS
ncbi:MAG: RNA methyltransferase [Planctomycetota bacterium]